MDRPKRSLLVRARGSQLVRPGDRRAQRVDEVGSAQSDRGWLGQRDRLNTRGVSLPGGRPGGGPAVHPRVFPRGGKDAEEVTCPAIFGPVET